MSSFSLPHESSEHPIHFSNLFHLPIDRALFLRKACKTALLRPKMTAPEEPAKENLINQQTPNVVVPIVSVEDATSEAETAVEEDISSDKSDEEQEKVEDITDASKRRRVQNAKFEAL